MTYSTGSGDYNALMAAVLAHAITDGWTTSGGNWPISKGNVRGVNWATRTISATDFRSGSGLAITERIIDLAVGTSLSNSTTNAGIAANAVQVRGMQYSITEWFIFSNPAAFNYIHVVTRSSNGYDSDVYQHFSFGELDKGGMTYTAVAYAAASGRRPYVALAVAAGTQGQQSYDWNGGQNTNWPCHFSGWDSIPSNYDRFTAAGVNNIVFIISPTVSPVPGSGGWPQPDTIGTQVSLLDTCSPDDLAVTSVGVVATNSSQYAMGLNFIVGTAQAQPYSGGVSFAPLPFIIMNGQLSTSSGMFLGIFPGVRICSLSTFAAKDEVTYASDTWKLMPLLKKTAFSFMQLGGTVSSGETGYAYKKVA